MTRPTPPDHGPPDHGPPDHGPPDHGPHASHGHEHPSGLRGLLGGFFAPHSHDAADSVDSALESSADGIRAVKVSLVVLLVTALVQALLVVLTGSVALLADTIHNLADALTAVPLWIAFVLGRRRSNARYTHGYGRAEDLAGIVIVLTIAASAVLAGYESLRRLGDPAPLTYPWVVVAAGLVGFAGNELVATYRIRVGRRIGSAALVADGLHARTDGFTSLAVVLGALGVLSGFPLADPVVGLLITAAILVVLRSAATDIYRRLMDAVDPALTAETTAVLQGTPGVIDTEHVRLRWVGHRISAEAGVVVDAGLDLVTAHDIATDAHHRLLHAVPTVAAVTIHVSPQSAPGRDHHAALDHHGHGAG